MNFNILKNLFTMPSRVCKYVALFTFFFLIAFSAVSQAVNLRGQVVIGNTFGFHPASDVLVELRTRNQQVIGRAITGRDGMYYMAANIPPGNYILSVGSFGQYQIQDARQYQISIYNIPFQDIPPLFLK